MKIGVIIGRFQTPRLTKSHRQLIDKVYSKSEAVVIMVGQSDVRNTHRYPLSFEAVKTMLQEYILFDWQVDPIVVPVFDHISNEYWSQQVDEIIGRIDRDDEVTLYGGRDSFIPYYSGKYKTEELSIGVVGESATRLREAIGFPETEEERRGAIWAAYYRYPAMYSVIDCIAVNDAGEILLARKKGNKVWQLIGGFVDPADETLENAVQREMKEETGLEVQKSTYFFTTRISDVRYAKEVDKVMSHVFLCQVNGNPTPMDDIEEAQWFDPDNLPEILYTHKPMIERLKTL